MNRRDFLKLDAVLFPAAAFGKLESKPMATNGSLSTRALRGETLHESELQQLELSLDAYDRTRTFTEGLQDGTGKLNVSEITARFGYFEKLPTSPFAVGILSGNTQTIANNSETVINPTYNDNPTFPFAFDDSTNRIKIARSGRIIFIAGTIQWANNATGRRGIHNAYYNQGGTLLGAKTMHSMTPTGVDADTFPFVNVLDFRGVEAVEFEFTVIQTSGGNLDIQFFQAHTWIIE